MRYKNQLKEVSDLRLNSEQVKRENSRCQMSAEKYGQTTGSDARSQREGALTNLRRRGI